MQHHVLQLFAQHPEWAILISLAINVLVAVVGVLPSVFVTAANVLFFGFWPGTLISFAGEALGAFIAFLLYRFGFKRSLSGIMVKYPAAKKLIDATGQQAFFAIISLRLIPFVPSGIITFAAAVGKVGAVLFLVASSLGKIPALLLEAYAAYQVTAFGWQGKLILLLAGIYLLYLFYKKTASKPPR